jgi:hypothetical protein
MGNDIMTVIRRAGSVFSAMLMLCATVTAAQAQQTWSWNRALGNGQTIEIKGINGAVTAQPTAGGEVRVTAVKTARRSNVESVIMEVVEHAGGVTICAVYPSPDRRANECRPGSDGRMNVQNNDVQVEFTVHVPRGVNFSGRSVNGAVEARDLTGDVEAHTVNGAITVVTAGRVRAGTVNGAVDVTMGRADWTGSLSFGTVNGALTVRLPDNVNADVRASTVNGDLHTDFPLTVQGRFGRRRIEGTIGSGGRTLELSTVNGPISLRRVR